MDEHFEWSADLTADLEALKTRLEQARMSPRSREKPRVETVPGVIRNPPWRKVLSYLKSVRLLTLQRHRVALLEAEVLSLRRALAEALETLGGNLSSITHDLQALTHRAEDTALEGVRDLAAVKARVEDVRELLQLEGARDLAAVKARVEDVRELLQVERHARQRAFNALEQSVTSATPTVTVAAPLETLPTSSLPLSVQSLLESFYFLLEDRYRGPREEIKRRLGCYLDDLRAACERAGAGGLVIDIGCGRGELLELLTAEGVDCVGVDNNDVQLQEARTHGCTVVHAEAFGYLQSLQSGSVAAVTGIHIVEHIPFPQLAALMQEVARVLKPGGLALFETPNPRNLIVGATTFHLDPTHIRPLPPEVLATLMEAVGFAQVEIRPLHPSDTLESMVQHHNLDRHIATLLFGPQDYAALGVLR